MRIDPELVRQAQRILKAKTKTETVELALESVIEMEKHKEIIRRYSGKGTKSSFALS